MLRSVSLEYANYKQLYTDLETLFPYQDTSLWILELHIGLNCKHPVIYDNKAVVMWMVLLVDVMHCCILSYNH